MNKILTFTIGVATVGIALALGLMGPANLWTTLRASRNSAGEALENAKSDPQRVAEIRVELQDFDEQIHRFADELGKVESRAAATDRQVQELDKELAKQRDVLTRAKSMLDENRDTYQISGARYSRAELNADAHVRLGKCEQITRTLETQRAVAKQLNDAVAEARTNLTNARLSRQQKAVELVALEARLENARMLQQVNELTSRLKSAPLGPKTELARKLEAFEQRVASAERRAASTGVDVKGGSRIDWDGKAGAAPEAGDAIARFLAANPSEK